MGLTKEQINSLQKKMEFAAMEAGKLILEHTSTELKVMDKFSDLEELADGELENSLGSQVVTEVDFLAQEKILSILQPVAEQHDFAVLAEEAEDNRARLEKDYFFAVDPLDGTLAFAKGIYGYSVSIALISKSGTPIIGVVYEPTKQKLYSAAQSMGACVNGSPLKMAEDDLDAPEFKLLVDSSFKTNKYYDKTIESLAKVFPNTGIQIDNKGGAVVSALYALENPNVIYFKFPKPQTSGGSIWDYAATACIYNECGAKANDVFGEAFELNTPVSTFMNHKGLIYAKSQKALERIFQLRQLVLGL